MELLNWIKENRERSFWAREAASNQDFMNLLEKHKDEDLDKFSPVCGSLYYRFLIEMLKADIEAGRRRHEKKVKRSS